MGTTLGQVLACSGGPRNRVLDIYTTQTVVKKLLLLLVTTYPHTYKSDTTKKGIDQQVYYVVYYAMIPPEKTISWEGHFEFAGLVFRDLQALF